VPPELWWGLRYGPTSEYGVLVACERSRTRRVERVFSTSEDNAPWSSGDSQPRKANVQFARARVANAHGLSRLPDKGSEATRLSGDLLDTTLEWLPISDIDQRTGLKPSRFFLNEISRVNLVRHRAMLGSSSVSRQMVGETLFSAESVQSCSIVSRPKRGRLPQLAALLVLGTRRGP
jgi:hypothetical protein